MIAVWLPLIGGLVLLVAGGDLLVRGAVRVAERLGVSPLVIGLTLVGFGTSTPELVTSVQAALAGSPGIAFGNIVGSNIANILLILGISAMLFPIAVASSALSRDAMVMLGVTVAFAALSFLMPFGRVVGVIFVAALGAYIYLAFRQEGASSEHGAVYDKAAALEAVDPAVTPAADGRDGLIVPLFTAIGGLVLVIFGGRFLVGGAVSLAEILRHSRDRDRADHRRARNLHAGTRHLGAGDVQAAERPRLRQHRRVQHLQHPRNRRGDRADRAQRACRWRS